MSLLDTKDITEIDILINMVKQYYKMRTGITCKVDHVFYHYEKWKKKLVAFNGDYKSRSPEQWYICFSTMDEADVFIVDCIHNIFYDADMDFLTKDDITYQPVTLSTILNHNGLCQY